MTAQGNRNTLIGGDIINRALQRYGAQTCFVLAGTAHAHLLWAMEKDRARYPWTIVSGRHESATVSEADGYARASGKLGIAMINAEQGLPNAMTGICTAQAACVPVLVLTTLSAPSQLESRNEGSNDALDMVKPFVKWARTVPNVERLEEYVHAGAISALSGRPGVAVLGIPHGLAAQAAEMMDRPPMPLTEPLNPAPSDEALERAADLIAKAKRPLILVGTGAALSGAGPALRKLASTYRFPVLANALGRGLVPEDLQLGFGWPLAQVAAKHADVVLCLGMRLTRRMGFGLAPRFSADAKFIQVDVHAEELGRSRPIDLAIVGDVRLAVEKLDAALAARAFTNTVDPAWINAAMAPRLSRIAELGVEDTGPIHPYRIGRELAKRLPVDAIYVGDGADIQNWMHGIIRIQSERAFMDHYPLGSMGVGTPLAVGAAAAMKEEALATGRPARPVVLVTGDGAFGFYASEFNGAVNAGLKLICIISNDGGWGTEKHGQIKTLGAHINCELGHCDYHLVGQGYGTAGERIEMQSEIGPALDRAFASPVPVVLNIITDPMAGLLRKEDPRVQCIAVQDLVSSLKTHYAPREG